MQLFSHSIENVQVLELTGSFDAYHAPAARQWLERATEPQPAYIVVNLKDVSFMDSTALSVLVQGLKRSQAGGGDLKLCSLQQPVRIIFELTRLDRVFEIYPDEASAARSILKVLHSVQEQPFNPAELSSDLS